MCLDSWLQNKKGLNLTSEFKLQTLDQFIIIIFLSPEEVPQGYGTQGLLTTAELPTSTYLKDKEST